MVRYEFEEEDREGNNGGNMICEGKEKGRRVRVYRSWDEG